MLFKAKTALVYGLHFLSKFQYFPLVYRNKLVFLVIFEDLKIPIYDIHVERCQKSLLSFNGFVFVCYFNYARGFPPVVMYAVLD